MQVCGCASVQMCKCVDVSECVSVLRIVNIYDVYFDILFYFKIINSNLLKIASEFVRRDRVRDTTRRARYSWGFPRFGVVQTMGAKAETEKREWRWKRKE